LNPKNELLNWWLVGDWSRSGKKNLNKKITKGLPKPKKGGKGRKEKKKKGEKAKRWRGLRRT